MKTLVLASTSPYREQLLKRLTDDYVLAAPDCDEAPKPDESASELVLRLARQKAESVAAGHAGAIVIGSDQVAERDGMILGKPGNLAVATEQLKQASGRSVMFYTGICVLDTESNSIETECVTTQVRFRSLDDGQIGRYLEREKPFDCAGSFKSEGLGVSLFQSVGGDDSTALVGLPLIRLTALLNKVGYALP